MIRALARPFVAVFLLATLVLGAASCGDNLGRADAGPDGGQVAQR